MKKTLYYILAITVAAFSACKKDHQNPGGNTGEGRKITFAIKGDFTQQVVQSGSSVNVNSGRLLAVTSDPNAIKSTFDTIFYYVLNPTTGVSKTKHFSAKSYSSTLLSDTLAPGTYTIGIYFGQKGFTGGDYGTYSPYANGDSQYANFFEPNTFGTAFTLTVGSTDITQSVTINRLVADVDITITDVMPANAAKLDVWRVNDYYYINPWTAKADSLGSYPSPSFTPTIPTSAIGATNFETSFITANTISPMRIILTCYDKSNNVIAQKTIGPYTIAQNEKLMLSGPLFNGSSGATGNSVSHISVDTTWKATQVNQSF